MAAWCKRKLALLYFVMAAQASFVCFSFYHALNIFSKKIVVYIGIFIIIVIIIIFIFLLPGYRF